jgi:hypothetical protein
MRFFCLSKIKGMKPPELKMEFLKKLFFLFLNCFNMLILKINYKKILFKLFLNEKHLIVAITLSNI